MKSTGSSYNCKRQTRRRESGVALLFAAFAFVLFAAFAAFAVDVSRSFLAAKRLQFASESAATYGLSCYAGTDGSAAGAQSRIGNAVIEAGSNEWNRSPSGDSEQTPVSFADSDIQFVQNDSDKTETVLRVTAKLDGSKSLTQYFMPIVFLGNIMKGGDAPDDAKTVALARASEVIGQPATRIGPGPVLPNDRFGNSAVFPLALSNQQFAQAATTAQVGTQYAVDLPSSTASIPLAPQHIRGAFVNDASGSSFSSFYGSNSGTVGIDQLLGLIDYFVPGSAGSTRPQSVERGVLIGAFDPSSVDFQNRKSAIVQKLKQIPIGSYLILPVIQTDPSFTLGGNKILGFARVRVVNLLDPTQTDFRIVLALEESVPVRNAVVDNAHKTIPAVSNSSLPPPVMPFLARTFDNFPTSIQKRVVGVALAPGLSPRSVILQ